MSLFKILMAAAFAATARAVAGRAVAAVARPGAMGGYTVRHAAAPERALLPRCVAGLAGPLAPPAGMRFDGRAAATVCAAAGLPGGERLRTSAAWALRVRQPQQQVRALADGDGRWDREGQRGGGQGAGGWDADAEDGVTGTEDPSHPHGLNVSVFHGNVDLAMRKLRRKVIVEGVMKKFKKNRVRRTRRAACARRELAARPRERPRQAGIY